MLLTELNLKTFTGSAIKPYLHSIARLSKEVFKEYPYLCDVNLDEEARHLAKYTLCEEAIACLLFDGTEVVGAATGMPLCSDIAEIQKPLTDLMLDTKQYYHFTEALLLKPYRRRGAGHHFYDIREEHARKLGFSYALLYVKDIEESYEERPKDFFPLDDFWRKRGFVHHSELKVMRRWKNISEREESDHLCSFWIKKL